MRLFLSFLLTLLLSPLALADDAAQRLGVRLDGLKSLRAEFVQSVIDESGKVLQTSQGKLAVKRGNRLRWETHSPFAYLIVTDGNVLWRYDQDLEQATRQKFSGELADTPALILSGDMARIRANYTITREQGSAGEYFNLVPRKEGSLFRSLTLHFAGNSIDQLVLLDNLEQRTEIRFNSVISNPSLDDKLFNFVPPQGIDVIDDES